MDAIILSQMNNESTNNDDNGSTNNAIMGPRTILERRSRNVKVGRYVETQADTEHLRTERRMRDSSFFQTITTANRPTTRDRIIFSTNLFINQQIQKLFSFDG